MISHLVCTDCGRRATPGELYDVSVAQGMPYESVYRAFRVYGCEAIGLRHTYVVELGEVGVEEGDLR